MPDLPDGRHRRPAGAGYPMPYLPGPATLGEGERPTVSAWQPPYASRGRSRWHWLLLVPIALPLATPLYDRMRPELLGVPFFYWCQIAFVPLTMAVITLANLATRNQD